MKQKILILGSLALVVVSGFMAWSMVAQRMEDTKRVADQKFAAALYQTKEWQAHAKLFGKNKSTAATIFAGATKVESFRLFSSGPEKAIGKTKNFNYFAKGITQNHRFAARLAAVVLDAKTYPWPGQFTKQCYFDPAVAFRIWKHTEFVDTIICFHCNQLVVLENNPQAPHRNIGGWLEGRFYVAGDFDVARPQLLTLAKEALPDDPQMQALS